MDAPLQPPVADIDRNRFILRRTLSTISWITAAWSGLLGLFSWGVARVHPLYHPAFLLGHTALLGLAGWALWRPRRGAWVWVMLAAAGSAYFVVLDLRRANYEAAAVDGAYIAVAAGIFAAIRPRA